MHVWGSKGDLQELLLSFHHMGARDQTQVENGSRCLPTESSPWASCSTSKTKAQTKSWCTAPLVLTVIAIPHPPLLCS